MKPVRCAIYTRKSSEEGLEQEFNSLHAQREACEAYITSQKHEGWQLIKTAYDDGGVSGGTMERPALKQLLADIQAKKVDIIVVYKVDRLTRSLMDFAKLVELMDKAGVSFVSVTQQFNTTTSMGRLTLNVLLSFAQFEREVTGERIRDKIALSKQRGKWMGGVPPMGYDVKEHKLIINEPDAEVIRHIFRRYVDLKTVHDLKAELDATNVRTTPRAYESGRTTGGRPFQKGHLYRILQNRIYVGDIVHKDKSHPGQHEAIVDVELFDAAQKLLTENRVKKLNGTGKKAPCMLTGRLFDDRGHPMSPKHSRTRRLYYRYYTSQAIIKGTPHEAGSLPNIPAHEIERLVQAEVQKFLKDGQRMQPILKEEPIKTQQHLLKTAAELTWQTSDEARLFVKSVVHRVELSDHDIKIELCGESVIRALKGEMHAKPIGTKNKILIARDVKLAPTRDGSKVVVGSSASGKNMQLIKAVTRSFLWNEQLLSGEKRTVRELGLQENIKAPSYVTKVMHLRFLAPDIIESILDGTHPADWTVEKLFAINSTNWPEQRKALSLN
jgi:site-specific DNA recombinase